MNEKPKSQKVFQHGQISPITENNYIYKQAPYLNGSSRLTNTCSVINNTGAVSQAEIGRFFDFIADFREETSDSHSATIQYNTDGIPFISGALPVIIIKPALSRDITRF